VKDNKNTLFKVKGMIIPEVVFMLKLCGADISAILLSMIMNVVIKWVIEC
jgi:hypothetical protein